MCRYAFALYRLRDRAFSRTDNHDGKFRDLITLSNEFNFDMTDISRLRQEMKKLIESLSGMYAVWKQEEDRNEQAEQSKRKRSNGDDKTAVQSSQESSTIEIMSCTKYACCPEKLSDAKQESELKAELAGGTESESTSPSRSQIQNIKRPLQNDFDHTSMSRFTEQGKSFLNVNDLSENLCNKMIVSEADQPMEHIHNSYICYYKSELADITTSNHDNSAVRSSVGHNAIGRTDDDVIMEDGLSRQSAFAVDDGLDDNDEERRGKNNVAGSHDSRSETTIDIHHSSRCESESKLSSNGSGRLDTDEIEMSTCV